MDIVGDFGGTNARLAISNKNGIEEIQEYKCENFASPMDVIQTFIEQKGLNTIKNGVFAIAGAATDPSNVTFTNGPWKQKPLDFTSLDIENVQAINDFDAICNSVATLHPNDSSIIVPGHKPFYPSVVLNDSNTYQNNSTRLLTSDPQKRFTIVGPGTGLGVSSGFIMNKGQFLVVGGEGGHSDFAPDTQEELELNNYLESMDKIVTAETIASGTGLMTTFNAICEMRDLGVHIKDASELTEKLCAPTPQEIRKAARWTFNLFAKTLGKCAASSALVNNASTVFIAGGVVPKLGDNFYKNSFIQHFRHNDLGANNTLNNTPVVLITHKQPGLLGAHSLLQLQND